VAPATMVPARQRSHLFQQSVEQQVPAALPSSAIG